MDRVGAAGKRRIDGAIAFRDCIGTVDVERRAMVAADPIQRDAVAHERCAFSRESGHE